MKYGIKTNDNIIAKFEHRSDRDVCIDALMKVYTDTKFEAVDNLEEALAVDSAEEQAEEQTEDTAEEQAEEEAKQPICPINMYFEGDENKFDASKCDFDTERRECSTGCEIKKDN